MSLKWHSTKPFDSNSSDETELQELELGWKTISRRSTYDERSCRFCGGESKWNFSRYFLHPVSASTVFFLPLSLSRSFSSFRRRGIGASLARTRIVVAIEILFPTVNRVFPCEPHGSGRGNLIFAHVEKKKQNEATANRNCARRTNDWCSIWEFCSRHDGGWRSMDRRDTDEIVCLISWIPRFIESCKGLLEFMNWCSIKGLVRNSSFWVDELIYGRGEIVSLILWAAARRSARTIGFYKSGVLYSSFEYIAR